MTSLIHHPKRNVYGGAALIALVLALGAWQDLSTPERRAALHQRAEAREAKAEAASKLDELEMAARGMCQEAVTFHTQKRAKLGWAASAWMPGGDFIIQQPFTINTLSGKRQFEARCTLRANGSFDVLMQD